MKKIDVVQALLQQKLYQAPIDSAVTTFAPTNIALCKYWGKRNQELNLPVTNSLSISLAHLGAKTTLQTINDAQDKIILNNQEVNSTSQFAGRLVEFLNLFREPGRQSLQITIEANIPIAAGLASSACGFASLIKALNELYVWKLTEKELSILARLGSGSASRSLWDGFVEWHAGSELDGMDSHGELLTTTWPELCIGLLVINENTKELSSRAAMQQTVMTSPFYKKWPEKVADDLVLIKEAINNKNIELLGKTAEKNALAMHATMLTAWPPIQYSQPETINMMQKIWQLRQQGLSVYFTQDAGPNLKLLFLTKDQKTIQAEFSGIDIVKPFLS